MTFVHCSDALAFLQSIPTEAVDLVLTDPPYFGIVKESWDNQWPNHGVYSDWLRTIMSECLRRPARNCQKPEPLIKRLVETHSNPGQLIIDPFCGYGVTGTVALSCGRLFIGCEAIPEDAQAADQRCKGVLT